MDHFGLTNAKIQFGIRAFRPNFDQNGRLDHFGPVHFPTVLRPPLFEFRGRVFRREFREFLLRKSALETIFCPFLSFQMAENGGLDPSWLDLAFFGRPDFPVQRFPKTYFKGLWDLSRKRQIQPRRIQPPTSRPCDSLSKTNFVNKRFD